jgi:8-oxo-dGTP diphosphatase
MTKPVKESVALALYDEFGRVLAVQRPEDDEDLPNAWGLPASSLRAEESWDDAMRRTGRDKLGVELKPIRELNRGRLERASYTLEMRLYEVEIVNGEVKVPQAAPGVTQYRNARWGTPDVLRPAAERGSLCCRLFLDSIS